MKLFALAAASAALLCAQAPTSPLPDETVVATSDGGKPITAGEIRAMLSLGNPSMNAMARKSPDQFLGSVALLRYLAEEGEKAHLASESPLKEQLKMVHDQMLSQAMLNRIREVYSVPQPDIDQYYAENKSRYEQAWIKVIVLGFCPAAPKPTGTSVDDLKKAAQAILEHDNCASHRSEEEGLTQATKLVAQIRAGEDFVAAVKKYSEDDDSKATDGDFGLVTRDNSFKPEIKAAVFSLKDGEISDPIRSGASFYIVKIKEKSVQPLSNVQETIISDLKQKHFSEWLTEINKRFKPVIEHPDFFSSLDAPKPTK